MKNQNPTIVWKNGCNGVICSTAATGGADSQKIISVLTHVHKLLKMGDKHQRQQRRCNDGGTSDPLYVDGTLLDIRKVTAHTCRQRSLDTLLDD